VRWYPISRFTNNSFLVGRHTQGHDYNTLRLAVCGGLSEVTLSVLKQILKRVVFFVFPGAGRQYVYKRDHTVINDYAEFSGLSIRQIQKRVNSYKALTRAEWNRIASDNFEEKVNTFYSSSIFYICDILAANVSKQALQKKLQRFTPFILDSIRNHPGHCLLEFGGGTGVFCEIAQDLGKEVTYIDIPGQHFEFAKWRFAKYGIPVRMLETIPGKLCLGESYDIIFTDAVMEHLADPYTTAAELSAHLNPGGLLIMLIDLSGEDKEMPMHKDVDIERLHQRLLQTGLINFYGLRHFASIWSKPYLQSSADH